MPQSVLFVVGMDDSHVAALREIAADRGVAVDPLLPFSAVRKADSFDFEALLAEAEERIEDVDDIAGFTAYWDLPASCIAAVLAQRHGLPTPGLEAVAAVEHKYWSRRVQAEVVPEVTPAFDVVDPRDDGAADAVDVPLPLWVKPVKSYSSHLGRRVDDPDDLDAAIGVLRAGTSRLGRPMQQVVDRLDVPPEIARVPATAAIAEELLDGDQVTVEGSVHEGELAVHGLFDIHREANGTTFAAYGYPSTLPDDARKQMVVASERLMGHLGWDDGPFNIEFFHDPATDEVQLLEVNPRISQEHSRLMRWVDDITNLEVMVDLALGNRPAVPQHDGPHDAAAKFFLRAYEDAVVSRVPSTDAVARVEEQFAPCRIQLLVGTDDRLSEQPDQETYSYELAYVYLAGRDHDAIEQRYCAVVDALGIELRPTDAGTTDVHRVDAARRATLDPVP